MRNTIKRLGALLIVFFILFLSCGFKGGYNPKLYNTEGILNIIKQLSSKEFNGRMAGTKEGKNTEEYVAAKFKELGLKPGGNNTYFQEFKGVSGNAAGVYALQVLDNNRIVKSYSYSKDYKYVTNLSYSGEVTSPGVQIEMEWGSIPKSRGEIALIRNLDIQAINFDTKPLVDLYEAGYGGVITVWGNVGSRLKGQMGLTDNSNASKLARVSVTPQVFDELVSFSKVGYKIHMKSSYEVKNFTARNVIGILKASKPTEQCLIISAHCDHLGPDPDGVYFPGALDNASGTACMIEIARSIISQRVDADVNIVFIAFSGEEEMLYGSRYYIKNPVYPLRNTRVINLDMVGAKSTLPVSILVSGSGKRGSNDPDIIEEFKGAADNNKFRYEVLNEDASDHSPFALSGVPAVTILDFEKLVYHVPEDTIDNIGLDNLKRAMDLTMEVIGEEMFEESNARVSIWIYGGGAAAVIAIIIGAITYMRKRKPA